MGMLLRDFIYLDWENQYYVIHAGDHIRLSRVEIEEYKKLMEQVWDWNIKKIKAKRENIMLEEQVDATPRFYSIGSPPSASS